MTGSVEVLAPLLNLPLMTVPSSLPFPFPRYSHLAHLSLCLFLSFSLLLDFLSHRECKPLPGHCSRNCLQGNGIKKKNDLPHQTKGIRESKRRSRNNYLTILARNFVSRVFLHYVFTYLLSLDNRKTIILK